MTSIKEMIDGSRRQRSIIVGEHHGDRQGLQATLEIISAAHQAGYNTLGVEVSIDGCKWGEKQLLGLKGELEYLRFLGDGNLSQDDEFSSLEPDHTGKRPRMNRYWQMQQALRLGWNIISIDPYHWNWMREDTYGYFDSRERAMADIIQKEKLMISVVGCAHLKGLYDLLAEGCFYVNTSRLEAAYTERLLFLANIPLVTVEK